MKQKKDINLQIKEFKKENKNEVGRENIDKFEEQLKVLMTRRDVIDQELINVDIQLMQSKIKIKKKKNNIYLFFINYIYQM